MKTHSMLTALVCLGLMGFTYPANDTLPHPNSKLGSNNSFQPGETIVYKIYYNLNFVWIPAGEVTFRVYDEGKQYHYQAVGETYDSYEWFYTVHDKYDSWVDKETLLPNYSERSIKEGKYRVFEKVAYNQTGRKTTVWRSHEKGMPETKTEHNIHDQVHDMLSGIYQLRNVDLSKKPIGATAPFSVFLDKEEYPLRMKYVGKDAKKKVHGMGRYKTVKYEPQLIAGNVFDEKAKMEVWVSDDENHIPILIESPVSVGSVKVVLKEYKNLKYDFTAKVD